MLIPHSFVFIDSFRVCVQNSALCTHIARFELCKPLVNGWRQWRIVSCCAKRSAGDGTKHRSHLKWLQQYSETIIRLKVLKLN